MAAINHTVVRGDSLSCIVHKNGIPLSKVLKLNPALAKNPNRIYLGDDN